MCLILNTLSNLIFFKGTVEDIQGNCGTQKRVVGVKDRPNAYYSGFVP